MRAIGEMLRREVIRGQKLEIDLFFILIVAIVLLVVIVFIVLLFLIVLIPPREKILLTDIVPCRWILVRHPNVYALTRTLQEAIESEADLRQQRRKMVNGKDRKDT